MRRSFSSRTASFAWRAACSFSATLTLILAFASAITSRRASRRSDSSGIDIPPGPPTQRFARQARSTAAPPSAVASRASRHFNRKERCGDLRSRAPWYYRGLRRRISTSRSRATFRISTKSVSKCLRMRLRTCAIRSCLGCSVPAMKRKATDSYISRSIARRENTRGAYPYARSRGSTRGGRSPNPSHSRTA